MADEPQRAAPAPDSLSAVDAVVGFFLFLVLPSFFLVGAVEVEGDARIARACWIRAMAVLLVLAYAILRRRALPIRLELWRTFARYGIFAAAWVPCAMLAYPFVLEKLGYDFPPQDVLEYLATAERGPLYWSVALLACLGAPLTEEIFFRGFLFTAIQELSGKWVALVATSVLFGLAHEVQVAIPVGALGCFFGYLRMKTGGIGCSVLAHIVHNTWTVAAAPTLLRLYDR